MLHEQEQPIKEWQINSLAEFMQVFKLYAEFEAEFGEKYSDNWENERGIGECEVMELLLIKAKGYWMLEYIYNEPCDEDIFNIKEYKTKGIT